MENSLFPKGTQLPAEWFTGQAFLTPLVAKDKNNDFSAGSVTFMPGARTNWHTHTRTGIDCYGRAKVFIRKKDNRHALSV